VKTWQKWLLGGGAALGAGLALAKSKEVAPSSLPPAPTGGGGGGGDGGRPRTLTAAEDRQALEKAETAYMKGLLGTRTAGHRVGMLSQEEAEREGIAAYEHGGSLSDTELRQHLQLEGEFLKDAATAYLLASSAGVRKGMALSQGTTAYAEHKDAHFSESTVRLWLEATIPNPPGPARTPAPEGP